MFTKIILTLTLGLTLLQGFQAETNKWTRGEIDKLILSNKLDDAINIGNNYLKTSGSIYISLKMAQIYTLKGDLVKAEGYIYTWNNGLSLYGARPISDIKNEFLEFEKIYPESKNNIDTILKLIQKPEILKEKWEIKNLPIKYIDNYLSIGVTDPKIMVKWRDKLGCKKEWYSCHQSAKVKIDAGIKIDSSELTDLTNENKKIEKMCKSSGTVYGYNCPTQMFSTAIKKGCKTIITDKFNMSVDFGDADPYDNKGECYIFVGELFQRISNDMGLFNNGKSNDYIVGNLPKGRYSEGKQYVGIVIGVGKHKYKTSDGSFTTVPVGKVISMK